MIRHPAFSVAEWTVTETSFSPEILAEAETVFSVSNGYLGLRGNLDEAGPIGKPGTYLNGFYECRPTTFEQEPPSARVPVSETALNVTDGKVIKLTVNGWPFDVRTGRVVSHTRILDMASAELTRECTWEAPGGGTIHLVSRRLASLVSPHLAAISYELDALEGSLDVEIVSSLVANESIQVREDDPRVAAPIFGTVLLKRSVSVTGTRLSAGYTTRTSRLNLVTAAEHLLEHAGTTTPEPFEGPGEVGLVYRLGLRPGGSVRLTKLLAYDWSAERSIRELGTSTSAVLDDAARSGYAALAASQREYAGRFWERTDVVIEGDPEVQQGLRFGLFQLMQAAAHAGDRGIAAKGLTGQGYDGHRFWDSEVFLVPILAHSTPEWARNLLEFRYKTLGQARTRAKEIGLRGALYPWRTITGADVSTYFPEGMAAYHLAADIAYAVNTYVAATGDVEFLARYGSELLVETARLWLDLGQFDSGRGGAFCIDEVTGPDEYSALVDNNIYTNLMAARNLQSAAATVRELTVSRPVAYESLVAATGLAAEEVQRWEDAASAIYVPYDAVRGIHPQDDAFLHHAMFDLASVPEDHRPLLLYYHPLILYGHQVVKQADLVLALRLVGDRFSLEEKRRNFEYYEPITVHESSLSAASHAVVAAEIGRLDKAMDYLRRSALVDLDDLADNVRDGVHLAGIASSWLAVVEGLAGFRHTPPGLSFAPQLPVAITRIAFRLALGDARLEVEIKTDRTRYRLKHGQRLELRHHDTALVLDASVRELSVPTSPVRPPDPPSSVVLRPRGWRRLTRAVGLRFGRRG